MENKKYNVYLKDFETGVVTVAHQTDNIYLASDYVSSYRVFDMKAWFELNPAYKVLKDTMTIQSKLLMTNTLITLIIKVLGAESTLLDVLENKYKLISRLDESIASRELREVISYLEDYINM